MFIAAALVAAAICARATLHARPGAGTEIGR
jgi:hypothetical protein